MWPLLGSRLVLQTHQVNFRLHIPSVIQTDLTKILKESRDEIELRHVWTEWHDKSGNDVMKRSYERFVVLSNRVAELNGSICLRRQSRIRLSQQLSYVLDRFPWCRSLLAARLRVWNIQRGCWTVMEYAETLLPENPCLRKSQVAWRLRWPNYRRRFNSSPSSR